MLITTRIEVIEREPVKQPATLLTECVIESGTNAHYKPLAKHHYRDKRIPPATHQVYIARHVPTGIIAGAIVYAAPAINLGIRNKIFGDRYKAGGKGKRPVIQRLNREVELIIRIVIHPPFRGVGLGTRLIVETLPKRPFRYVEMCAAMGAVHPFAEKAGMYGIRVPRPERTEKMLAMLRSFGLDEMQIANPAEILRLRDRLKESDLAWLDREMTEYATRWIKSRTNREIVLTPEICAKRIATNATASTVYYIWENPAYVEPENN